MIIYDTRDYISNGNYVFLRGAFSRYFEYPRGKLFKAVFVHRFPVLEPVNLDSGDYEDINMDDDLGMYPDSVETLYEIGVALRGRGILYPRLPSNTYYNYLEESGFIPADDLSTNKYIGGYTEEHLPVEEPKNLKIYTLKDMDTIVLRVYNDGAEPEKVVLDFTVNRVHIVEPTGEDKVKVLENFEKFLANGILKIIPSWKDSLWHRGV